LTPYETRLFIEAAAKGRNDEYRIAIIGAWHVEAFQRTKRLPKLAHVMKRLDRSLEKKRGDKLTPEQIWQGFKLHNLRLGGADNRKKAG